MDGEAGAAGVATGVFQVGTDGSLSGETYCIIGPAGSGSDCFVFQVGVVERPDGEREACTGEVVFQVGVELNSSDVEGMDDSEEVTASGEDGAGEPGDGMAVNGITGSIIGAGEETEGAGDPTWEDADGEAGTDDGLSGSLVLIFHH